jgi:hypothetical protein
MGSLERVKMTMPIAKQHPQAYQFTFYRELLGDNGKRFDSPLSTLRVETNGTESDAIQTAIKRFERKNKLQNWKFLATGFRMSVVD